MLEYVSASFIHAQQRRFFSADYFVSPIFFPEIEKKRKKGEHAIIFAT